MPDTHAPDEAPSYRRWLRPELIAPWWEVALVSAFMIGPFAWHSATAAMGGSSSHYFDVLVSNVGLLRNGAFEAALLSVFLFFLRWRGWTTADFKVRPGVGASAQGIGLFLTTEVVHAVTLFGLFALVYALQTRYASFVRFALTQVPHFKGMSMDVGWTVLVSSMILNAFMEELVCMGYFFAQVAAKHGPRAALLLTVMLRMACHTYQGPLNMLSIGAVFLVYGLWYWRTQNLWTLIFAHAFLDLFSTGLLKLLLHKLY